MNEIVDNATNSAKDKRFTILFHIITLAIVMVWGGTLVSSKILIVDCGMSEVELFVSRCVIAYIAIFFFSYKKIFADNWKDELYMLLLGVTGGSLYFISENYALNYTYANNVSFIVSVSPLITAFLGYAFIKGMKLGWKLLTGSLIALIGVGIVIFNGQTQLNLNPIGDTLAFISAFCWGIYCLFLKQLGNKYSSAFMTRKVFFYGFLTSLPLFIKEPWSFPLENLMEGKVLFNLLFLSLIASFACFFLWSLVVRKIGAVTASNYNYLSPMATIVLSSLFLNENMTILAWVGCILILFGVILANKNSEQ